LSLPRFQIADESYDHFVELFRQRRRQALLESHIRQFERTIAESRHDFSDVKEEKEAILFAYEVTETFADTEGCTSDCSICMEPILKDSRTYFKYECGHALHSNCVRQWMYTNPGRATCPVCRKEYAL
jgi:hypothetical protein